MSTSRSILIVGAGEFGLSTAYELLARGYTNVTIVDRAPSLPAPDAASTDMNKVVRSAYQNDLYARLAREAIADWKSGDWDNAYHESGVLMCHGPKRTPHSQAVEQNDIRSGGKITLLPGADDIKSIFPADIPLGEIAEVAEDGIKAKNSCYFNTVGGWVAATTAMNALLRRVRSYRNVTILTGYRVTGLVFHESKAVGVRGGINGEERITNADVIVLATGAWSPSLFPDDSFGLSKLIKATGQCVVAVQLTPEEQVKYDKTPCVLDTPTKMYMMPPTASGLLKWGLHHLGALSPHKISTPRTGYAADNTAPLNTDVQIGIDGAGALSAVPKSIIKPMRDAMRKLYPEIADRELASSRLCWYADTIDDNWLIDYHPDHPRVLLATACCGHAFKFLPVIGRVIADRLENKLDTEYRELFSFSRPRIRKDVLRVGEHIPLRESELTTLEDLKATTRAPEVSVHA